MTARYGWTRGLGSPSTTAIVAGPYDFRDAAPLRGVALNDAYVDVVRDERALSWIQLAAPTG